MPGKKENDYITIGPRALGSGSFGTVYKVKHRVTGRISAMKVTKIKKAFIKPPLRVVDAAFLFSH